VSHSDTAAPAEAAPSTTRSGPSATASTHRGLLGIAVVAVLLLVVAPHVLSPYLVNLIILTGVTAIPVASLMVLFGYAGQVSLGQAAFYGLGAYIYANLTVMHGVGTWLALLVAVVATASFAYAVGRGLLRLKGYYLAMVTAALGVIAETCFSNLTSLTGGYSGITGIPFLAIPGIDLSSPSNFYYVLVGFCVIILFVVKLLAGGEYGRVLRAMRESETVAAAYGVPIAHAKAQVFALSAGIAALGGCLFAQYTQFISPDNFTATFSVSLFLGAVLGGLHSIWGAVLGAAYVVVLPELASSYSQWEVAITGVLTLLILVFAPRGVVGLLERGFAAATRGLGMRHREGKDG
jgi:branched-chain amino acid transport system permease protein